MQIEVVSLFPEMVSGLAGHGVVGRALKEGRVALRCWNPRDYAEDAYRSVDDRPYGGGPGMVMLAAPLEAALGAARQQAPAAPVMYLSPQGRRLEQAQVQEIAKRPAIILLAGRYEGIDQRVIERQVDEEWSIGDYVLSGGELPALVLIDAVARQLPGVLGNLDSAEQDSFAEGLLDCPHYTRPESHAGLQVPEVLLSGNHEAIRRWRLKQALGQTWRKRPDLLEGRTLNNEEQALLDEFLAAQTEQPETT
ncbi:MAG: tRNA (guanosine(37)-N1)-methyltransferase TrmD [Gammaproteobacteria bacterium]|nr:tRNA (guanosine(37)-N1)-methyltransferase TrmD [Gammaproteobacteria bacterium]